MHTEPFRPAIALLRLLGLVPTSVRLVVAEFLLHEQPEADPGQIFEWAIDADTPLCLDDIAAALREIRPIPA